jgi:hypothetical protein
MAERRLGKPRAVRLVTPLRATPRKVKRSLTFSRGIHKYNSLVHANHTIYLIAAASLILKVEDNRCGC